MFSVLWNEYKIGLEMVICWICLKRESRHHHIVQWTLYAGGFGKTSKEIDFFRRLYEAFGSFLSGNFYLLDLKDKWHCQKDTSGFNNIVHQTNGIFAFNANTHTGIQINISMRLKQKRRFPRTSNSLRQKLLNIAKGRELKGMVLNL